MDAIVVLGISNILAKHQAIQASSFSYTSFKPSQNSELLKDIPFSIMDIRLIQL